VEEFEVHERNTGEERRYSGEKKLASDVKRYGGQVIFCGPSNSFIPYTEFSPRRNVKRGKSVTIQAWSGAECSRELRFPDFMTMAQDGGKVVSLYPPGNTPGTHFC